MRLTRESARACHRLNMTYIQSHQPFAVSFHVQESRIRLMSGGWNNSCVTRLRLADARTWPSLKRKAERTRRIDEDRIWDVQDTLTVTVACVYDFGYMGWSKDGFGGLPR